MEKESGIAAALLICRLRDKKRLLDLSRSLFLSDRRGSNPRPRPWQGRTPPTEPLSHIKANTISIYPQNHILKSSILLLRSISTAPSDLIRLSPRPISNSQLHTLLYFHLCPIYLVLFKGSYSCDGISHLEGGFTLRCLQRLSRPGLATLP